MHRCGCRSVSAAFITSLKHVSMFSKLASLGDYGPGMMLIQIQYVHIRFEKADRSIVTIVATFIIQPISKLIQSLTHAIQIINHHHDHPSIHPSTSFSAIPFRQTHFPNPNGSLAVPRCAVDPAALARATATLCGLRERPSGFCAVDARGPDALVASLNVLPVMRTESPHVRVVFVTLRSRSETEKR